MAGRLTALQALRNAIGGTAKTDSEVQQAARIALIENGYDWKDASREVAKA